MNMRKFVSNDHIMSKNEIMQTQSVAIQAYMIENEQLQKELKEVYDKLTDKEQQIDQLTNNWNELRQHIKEYLLEWENSDDEWVKGKCDMARDILYDMEEMEEGNNE